MKQVNIRAGERNVVSQSGAKPTRFFLGARTVPLIYLNIPKSGCTTIKNALVRFDAGAFLADPLTVHTRPDLLVRADHEPDEIYRRFKQDIVFTFVRHPLRRAYSCFNEKVHSTGEYSFPDARQMVEARYGGVFREASTLERHRENFKAFLRFAQDTSNGTLNWPRNKHWCPQSMILQKATRWRMLDFIGRIERFDAHWSVVLSLAGIREKFDIPQMNEGPPAPHRYEDILDDEIRQFGGEFYRSDFRNFGYSL